MPQTDALETATLTIADEGTKSNGVLIGNPTDIGLIIGTLNPAATLAVQVANVDDDAAYVGLCDKEGTAILVVASSSGGKAIDTNQMGAVLGYRYLRVVAGAAQTEGGTTCTLCRKISRTDPLI